MRIFKVKVFQRWARDEGLSDKKLKDAVDEIEQGLVDANLGGNLYKKRIGSTKGKRGGFRTLLAYKKENVAFFLRGFKKSESENITKKEETALKYTAEVLMNFNNKIIQLAIDEGELFEVL